MLRFFLSGHAVVQPARHRLRLLDDMDHAAELRRVKEVEMQRTARGLMTRSLAAAALVAVYGLGLIGFTGFVMGVPKAEAHGRRGRRGFHGFRGFRGFRGRRGRRGRGFGWGPAFYGSYYGDNCFWSPYRGRWVCPGPYPYRPYW